MGGEGRLDGLKEGAALSQDHGVQLHARQELSMSDKPISPLRQRMIDDMRARRFSEDNRNSSFTFKGKNVLVAEVGRDLGVCYVLEGSVRKSGARVRITAQLIDAMTAGHLWAERFDRDLTDIFAVQDDVTNLIVSALALNLSPSDRQNIGAEHADNHEAYDCFLRGRELWFRTTKDANRETASLLRRAIELDPRFAPAFAFLGATHVIDYANGWSASPSQELEEAEKAARHAMQLDERYPYALWALALAAHGVDHAA